MKDTNNEVSIHLEKNANKLMTINEMFEEKKKELKDWQYGTVYKMYDREEECEVLATFLFAVFSV